MSDYETVNNPYESNTGTYPPPGASAPAPAPAAAAPAAAPPGWVQNPDGSWAQVGAAAPPPAAATPPPAAAAAPPAAGGYPTGTAAAGGYPTGAAPAGPAPGAPPVPPASTGGGGEGAANYEARPIQKLGTQNGQPLEQLNLVMMTGYFQHMRDDQGNIKFTQSGNSTRLGFILAEEQTWTDNATGEQKSKVIKHRCQAWNDHAKALAQVYDGTPVKIWGNLTIYYPRDDNGQITATIVDIKVNKYDFP